MYSPKTSQHSRTFTQNSVCGVLFLFLPLTSSALASAQSANLAPAVDELQSRIKAAANAREVGNPQSVASANSLVLALAYRRLANVRVAQTAFLQAAELYRLSLSWEDSAETHVGLAICSLYENRPDDSLIEASKALLLDPNSARAWNIQGKAWMKKRNYAKAAESLQNSVQIHPEFESAYALGVSYLSLGDAESMKKAADVFDKIVASVGDSGSLHVLFGRAYRDAEMQDDSIRELRRAVALDTKTPHAHYFLGLSLLWKNEWTDTPEIINEFKTELQNYPKDFLGNYFLGYLYSNDRHYDEANKYLNEAVAIDSSWPEPWLFLGLNAYSQGDMAISEKYLRKCIELTGKDEARGNYQVRRAFITLGRILTASGRSKEAAPYLERAREFQKLSLAEAQQTVAGKASDEGSASTAAIVALLNKQEDRPIVQPEGSIDPSAPVSAEILDRSGLSDEKKKAASVEERQLRFILASSFSDLATSEAIRRDYASALAHYQDAERWDSSVPGLLRNLGVAAFRAQRYSDCVRALSQVVATNSADNAARAMLGSAYFALDKYRDAIKTIEPLGDRAVHDTALGYAWAASLTRLGELAPATKILEEYEKSDLSLDNILLVGQLWLDMADYSHAVQAFHRALDRDPSLMRAHYFAGIAQLHWAHENEAIVEFNAALKLAPDDPDAKIGMGYVLMQQAKSAEAMNLFRSVIATHPESGNAHYQLGKLLLEAGNTREAVEQLEYASRALPQTDYVHYQLQAAYRKDSRVADADRELQIYKELKSKNRQTTIPRPTERP
ncbi:MAG TPA: tetratricopeptide repeat protein [Candidatus Dormibacteraeota bacterium]|jgi:tetratricopeptide (TPR) repeat protein|nr:tetratricopeptide repeat protein [Candidatus Dormibacteraeota bacterium]